MIVLITAIQLFAKNSKTVMMPFITFFTPVLNHSNFLYAITKPVTSNATPIAIRLNGLSDIAMFVSTIAAAIAPMAAAIIKKASGLSLAQSAIPCKNGNTASTTGSKAVPIDSLVSPIEFFIMSNLPAAVSAFAATAPPNVSAI